MNKLYCHRAYSHVVSGLPSQRELAAILKRNLSDFPEAVASPSYTEGVPYSRFLKNTGFPLQWQLMY